MATSAPAITQEQVSGEVRGFMRDHAELNRLIAGEESSDRMIRFCTWMAVDEFNVLPPLTSYGLENFPSRYILIYLTIIHLLTSVGLLKSRNHLVYNDGGFSAQTEEQDTLYMRWIQLFRSQVDPKAQSLKIALNIEAGWGGGIGSEYGWINGWYGLT